MSKKILITGATSGIGKATAILAASKGHRVFLSGRNENELALLQKQINAAGSKKADVVNVSEVQELVKEANATMNGIDVLLNNAGLGIFDPLEEGKLSDWHVMV
ncbi:MAG: SDR family oxidoreductase, partial [Bacteroidota bacterium]